MSKCKQKNTCISKGEPLHESIKEINSNDPANIYLFKVYNRNTRKGCGICSKLTTKTPERRH